MLKELLNNAKQFLKSYNGKQLIYAILYNLLASLVTYYILKDAIELSSFAIGLMKFSLGLTSWVIFDILVLKDIDTLAEIKAGNIAVALMFGLYMASIALIIGLA